MIYAVNKRTKEHRRANASNTSGWTSPYCNWSVVMADADGWIEWHGGECPLPDGTPYETKHESGAMFAGGKPETFRSHWRGDGDAVIAYRPILDAKPEAPMPEQGTDATTPRRPFLESGRLRERLGPFEVSPPAWDGEGLPPVGCECEYYDAIQKKWMPASIVAHHINGEEAIWSESLDGGDLFYGTPHDFRPLRSAEDKAVEEMARIIADGHDVYIGAHEAAQRLYRAGYRKTGGE